MAVTFDCPDCERQIPCESIEDIMEEARRAVIEKNRQMFLYGTAFTCVGCGRVIAEAPDVVVEREMF